MKEFLENKLLGYRSETQKLRKTNEKDCSDCSSSWYQKGYEDGLKEGLKQANELMESFMKEYQEKMDRFLIHKGEE